MYEGPSVDAHDELLWLITNIAYARPREERAALLAAKDRLLRDDDQTVADLLRVVRTAMLAAQPTNSKFDHQKRRRDERVCLANMKQNWIYNILADKGIDPDEPNAVNLIGQEMYRRRNNRTSDDYGREPLEDYDIRRQLKEISAHGGAVALLKDLREYDRRER